MIDSEFTIHKLKSIFNFLRRVVWLIYISSELIFSERVSLNNEIVRIVSREDVCDSTTAVIHKLITVIEIKFK